MTINLRIESEKLVKSSEEKGRSPVGEQVQLSVFDTVTYNTFFPIIFTFRAPSVCNRAIELGLRLALAEYPEWAGRMAPGGVATILLNDGGVRLVEAACDAPLSLAVPRVPTPDLLYLHGARAHGGGAEQDDDRPLLHVQLTRFSCGGLAVGLTASHIVADGCAACSFWITWGRAAGDWRCRRGPPPRVEFEHRGVEYSATPPAPATATAVQWEEVIDDIVLEKVHFPVEFLRKLRAEASFPDLQRPHSTFETLVAHLWRTVTKARGVEEEVETHLRISVNGRRRMNPPVPDEYLGNLLLRRPLHHAAALIREAVARVDDRYFRSFIDFSEQMKAAPPGERSTPTAEMENRVLSPHLEVDSWLRFPFYDVDFGSGGPDLFTPTWSPYEGFLVLLPSAAGDCGVDVLVPLLRERMPIFKEICYSLEAN
ncbi:unnamed protein product [Spirodela intermedia]|uniref:Uncharacterized protein n=1 Tax=Spirodela intermedia TaxID=51605 RepID=A0A7I8JCJ7_SPIIN|nr:unnamed protein product [Spirodela intermedia]CAA6667223.1 unnamed protein product [Spirodela intermedia]